MIISKTEPKTVATPGLNAVPVDSGIFFDHAMEQWRAAAFLIDGEFRIIFVNDHACRSLGYSRDELLTMRVFEIDPFCTAEQLAVHRTTIPANDGPAILESQHRTKDGRLFPVELSISFFSQNNHPMTFVIARDISERKKFESLTQAHIRILQSTQSMELSLDQALRMILDEIETLTNSSIGFYHFFDEERQDIFMQGWSTNTVTTFCNAEGTLRHYPMAGAGVWADAVRKRRPVIHNDYASLPHRRGLPPGHAPVIRQLVVPVFRADTIVAIIGLGNKSTDYTDTDIQVVSLFGDVVWEIVNRKRLEESLAVREREFRTLAENSPDAVVRYDLNGRRVYVNPAFARLAEKPADQLLDNTPDSVPVVSSGDINKRIMLAIADAVRDKTPKVLELEWTDKNGVYRCFLNRYVPEMSHTGEVQSVLGVACDISERKAYQEQLYQLAYSDPLTSLPNRSLFRERLSRGIQDATRDHFNLGVMFIDLDGFKEINDSLGHDVGDELLKIIAGRLTGALRPEDTVARLGGDEFAILISRVREEVDLAIVARKLLATVKEPVMLYGRELFVTASIGIASFSTDSREDTGLLGCADVAMYHAKASGKNNFKFYSVSLTQAASERMELENDLRKALTQKELELYYQPKIHSIIGQTVGAEALVRWCHPTCGILLPDKFIGIAEDTGLICDIGAWVLHCACRAAVGWNKNSLYPVKVAVNISARQLITGDFVDLVRIVLANTECSPNWLELELTESMLMSRRTEIIASLEALDAMGISIAIDDFGTGYSSLSYLTEFPIRTIKIDKAFVRELTSDKRRLELVRAIISMGNSLGVELVAEGVETGEQAACLDRLGCHIIQGYYYGKPMPLIAFNEWQQQFSIVRDTEMVEEQSEVNSTWRDYLTTGHPLIDAQHRELFRQISLLTTACRQRDEKYQISRMLEYLAGYISTHFATEEALLIEVGSPHYDQHRAAHENFSDVVVQLVSRCREEGESHELTLETNYVAVEWLTRHICTMDRDLAERLRQHGETI